MTVLAPRAVASAASALVPASSSSVAVIPALVASLGEAAGRRYVEFFTANIRNANTRAAYARACSGFLA